ncbi:hypothetical protein F4781DRAFT_386899 [Annulohypoxylon bovei var. microspora]|nr:hypothetical protein F4781DRAFT_386899 [Annulohypoxylon bovei var. microspora]
MSTWKKQLISSSTCFSPRSFPEIATRRTKSLILATKRSILATRRPVLATKRFTLRTKRFTLRTKRFTLRTKRFTLRTTRPASACASPTMTSKPETRSDSDWATLRAAPCPLRPRRSRPPLAVARMIPIRQAHLETTLMVVATRKPAILLYFPNFQIGRRTWSILVMVVATLYHSPSLERNPPKSHPRRSKKGIMSIDKRPWHGNDSTKAVLSLPHNTPCYNFAV